MYTTFSNIIKLIYKFEHNKLINETGKILRDTNFFHMINFSILYLQNNLFEEHENGSEEKLEKEDDAGLSSCNKKQKTA